MDKSSKRRANAGVRATVALFAAAALALLLAFAGEATARGWFLPRTTAGASQAGHDLVPSLPAGRSLLPPSTRGLTSGSEDRALAQDVSTPDRCAGCHRPFTLFHYGQACGACHLANRFMPPKAESPEHPIPLVGQHAELRCRACHTGAQLPTPACTACHQPPRGHLAGACQTCHSPEGWAESAASAGITGPAAPHKLVAADDCLVCHAPAGPNWPAPADHITFNLPQCRLCHESSKRASVSIDHSRAGNLFRGRHLVLDCVRCHSTGQFQGTASACVACHQADDRHAGQFGQACGRCHSPDGWAGASFDHGQTGFALTGAHGSAACVACHAGGVFAGTPQNCFACHQDDDQHAGQFGQSCGRCHNPDGWAGASFDHGQTGFPLAGAHSGAACTSCHPGGLFSGTPRDCAACHQDDDQHAGQFGQSCGQCHSPDGWAGASFDHGLTGFPLTGAHSGAACTSCHPGGVFAGTPRDCVACHGEPGYHAGVLGTDCAACHNTSGWLPASFGSAHTFPLNHKGASGCRTCHLDSLAGFACYGCHDPGQIGEEHLEHGIPDYGNCVACHPTGDD